MNIDEEIKKLDEERDGLLVEITKKRNRVNELARKIRSLETIKRHASEVLESTGVKTIELTGDQVEDEIKDPAQLDLEIPLETSSEAITNAIGEAAEIVRDMVDQAKDANKRKAETKLEDVPSIIDTQIKDLIRNGGDPYAKYTGLVKEAHIKKMVDEVIAEKAELQVLENPIVDVSQEDSESY